MIEFKDVNFGYLQKDVLHNLSFTINKGETVGIIGGTGAGKSTLVSLIGRNYDVRSGQIKIAGKNIQDYNNVVNYVIPQDYTFPEGYEPPILSEDQLKQIKEYTGTST